VRQFLAIPIPEEAIAVLERVPRFTPESSSWRFVRRSSIHLTVRFLGEVSEEQDATLRAVWRATAASTAPFRMALGQLDALPSRRRARVLVVDLKEVGSRSRLTGLARGLETAATTAGFEKIPRPFHPHLTLARCSRGTRPRFPDPEPRFKRIEFAVDRIHLYRSDLNPGGARYTVLDSFPLGGGDVS